MRCLYTDLDGTLLGPGASLVRGADNRWSSLGVRALEACWRAGVEVVLYSGRRQASVFESARLIGCSAYVFELGCGIVIDDEREWLTNGLEPSPTAGSIFDQIDASGAPALLLSSFPGQLEYHTPWSIGREVSHLFRGSVDLGAVAVVLREAGLEWLRLVDNGVVQEHTMPGIGIVHAYHLIPAGASKARAIGRHMQARGYESSDCIATGDSREDLDTASVVGTFWLVSNALARDPSLEDDLAGRPRVRVCSDAYGAGVYEAVVTTLAGG